MRPTRYTCFGLAALLGAATACAPAAPPGLAPTRASPPPPLAERPLDFPGFQEAQLPNGMRLIVVEHAVQPVASVNLYIRSGAAREPAQQAGLAGLTAEVLTKGTTTRSATQIAEMIEGVGGSLNASAGEDWMSINASVLAENLPLAFDLVSDVTLRPTFPEAEVETARRRALSGLQAALGQPGEIARRRFIREVYGSEHAYGIAPVQGTVQGLQRADLARFHREHFAAGNALLVVAGAVNAAEVEALARRHFGEWTGAAAPAARLPEPPARERMRIYLVHRPGSVQSNIWIGHTGVRPGDPDYFPLLVLNRILGGGSDARLFQILREEKGWTYGAYSQFTRPVDVGYFAATAEVRTEVTDSAVAEMMRQLQRLQEEQVPTAEFDAAKSFLAGSFPLRIETAGQIASQVAQARLLGLDIEDVTRYVERIRAVTVEDVQRVARAHIRPGQAAIVVVGDAARVRPMLEPLGPIQLYDVEGQLLEAAALEVRAATERFTGTRLQAGTRTYQFNVQGNPMGTFTSTLAREGDDWVARGTMQSPMMGQESEVRFRAADLTPISTRQTQTQGPMRVEIELQHANGRVTGRAQLPEQMGGDRAVDTEVPAGTLLPGMDEHVLAAAELREGQTLTLPVFNPIAGSVANVTYRVTGAEEVTVPAGTFPAYRVEITGGQQPMTLHVRREAPHLMLRQELVGLPVTIELQAMQ